MFAQSSYYSPNDSDNDTSDIDRASRVATEVQPYVKPEHSANMEDKGAVADGTSSDSLSDGEAEQRQETFYTPPVSATTVTPRIKALGEQVLRVLFPCSLAWLNYYYISLHCI